MKFNKKIGTNISNERKLHIKIPKHIIIITKLVLLSLAIILTLSVPAFAWGPLSPANSKWVTGSGAGNTAQASCTFSFETSGLAYCQHAYYEIYNNGSCVAANYVYLPNITWGPLTSGSTRSFITINLNQSALNNSYWRIQFYKWDGYDECGNPFGAAWTSWSNWGYFGVDCKKPATPGPVSPDDSVYVKCSAANPLTLDWGDVTTDYAGGGEISGLKQYRLVISGSGTTYPTTSYSSFTSLTEGWHNWNVYSQDNCYGIAFDSSTHWESDASTTRKFYVDNTAPTIGVKQLPNYTFPGSIVNTDVAINNTAPVAGENDYNPQAYGVVTATDLLALSWTAATDAGGVSYYNLMCTCPTIGTINKTITSPSVSYNLGTSSDGVFYDPIYKLKEGKYEWNITAYDQAGNSALYSSNFKVTIDRHTPTVGLKSSPATNYFTSNPIITFKWTSATDNDQIKKYELYIAPYGAANYSSFADCANTITALQNITQSPFGLTEGKYQWNIKTYDRALNYKWYGSGPSDGFAFTYDKTPPVAGAKIAPHWNINGDMFCTNVKTVNFSWSAAVDSPPASLPSATTAGIDKYELYVDGALSYSGTACNATVANLSEGLHSWNVKVIDKAGNFSYYDPDWQFKVDLTPPIAGGKIKPIDNYKINNPNLNFQWGDSNDTGAGASGVYRLDLIISGAASFTIPNVKIRDINDFAVNKFGAGNYSYSGFPEGEYTWNIKVFDRAGNSALYDAGKNFKFTIDLTPPIAGTKIAPAAPNVNIAEYPEYSTVYISNNNKLEFKWDPTTDNFTNAANLKYNLTIYKGASMAAQYSAANVTSPFTNTIALPDGDYTWNITAIDEAGNNVEYGARWKLKIDTKPPVAGELYAVEDLSDTYVKPDASGMDIDTGTPTFIWTSANDSAPGSGIDKYKIIIEIPKGNIKFNSDYIIAPPDKYSAPPNMSFVMGENLPDDGPYFWTIWVKDIAGNEIKYPQQWNFYVDTELAFVNVEYEFLLSRENSKVPGSPAIYQPSPAYEVQVSVKTNQYTPTVDIIPDTPVPSSNKYGTTYYWSVRNKDVSGLWGKYEDYSISIVSLCPGVLSKPSDKSYCPIKPKFEWTHALPNEVRQKYRLLVFKNSWNDSWVSAHTGSAPIVDYSTTSVQLDGNFASVPYYQSPTTLADGLYYWSVYMMDDMTRETRFNQVWSFEIVRKPFVTMASSDLKWYAGYSNGIFVDAFGANGFDSLGSCEVTLYKDAAGTQKIRKLIFTDNKAYFGSPAKMTIEDGDTSQRFEVCNKLYSNPSFVITDNELPSNKRYLFNLAPHFNYIDKYGASNKIYAKARVYFYDSSNPTDMSVYTDCPASGTMLAGDIQNSVKLRPYNIAATEATESVFFACATKNSKKDYTYLTPAISAPPQNVLYVNNDVESDDARAIYYNGMAFFDSAHEASTTPLSSGSASTIKDTDGKQNLWRVTYYPNSYNQAMRLKLFKDPNYLPQNTYDFMKVLGEFSGTTPVLVKVAAANYVNGDLDTVKNSWNEALATNFLDRGEGPADDNTLTKYETWVYATAGDSYKLTYAADMASQVILNGEALNDKFNHYNQDESQHRNCIEIPLSSGKPSMLLGWNHLIIYVLHQKKSVGNMLNGICYKLEGPSQTEAFKGAYSHMLWHSFPMPQPNNSDFLNNGRGTSIVVYNQVKSGGSQVDVIAKQLSGVPAIYSSHKGVFFADKSAIDKLTASKPLLGGDHKISMGIVSNEINNTLEPRFSTASYGDNGYLKMHINNTPYSPASVNRINTAKPVLTCPELYKDVESVNTLTPTVTISENLNLDPDNPGESEGFHHSMYFNDYLTHYTSFPSIRTDEVHYVYAISTNDVPENFYDINWAEITYRVPGVFSETFTDYLPPTHTVASGALQEAKNVGGVISPIYSYRCWAKDEHGELQMLASSAKKFCVDLTPPVVADIQVYYDCESVRLDSDISPLVENDMSVTATNPIALIGHTVTLWAFCTDEITADPRNFLQGKFFIRKSESSGAWVEVDATCEVDTTILFEDNRFAFNRTPSKHPNGYHWYGFYTIPYDSDLTHYDVDFQISDAVGNRSKKLTDSGKAELIALTKKQFKAATIGLNKISVAPALRTTILSIFWQPFLNWRDSNSVDHYIVSIGDLTPNPFETSNWVSGDMAGCTREVRTEGKLPIFISPVEKIPTLGFSLDLNDQIYSFEEPKSLTNRKDGWTETVESGGYFSADIKKVKDGMYSWSSFANPHPGVYSIYKDFNIGPNLTVAFGTWIKKETITSQTRLQAICYDINNGVIDPNANGVTFENDYDNVTSDAWVHYYLNVNDKPYFVTPPATRKIRLQITGADGCNVYIDQIGFAAYTEATIDFTPPQKPELSIGIVNNHINTRDRAALFGYWDGQWDIKGSAWLDEPSNFPTLKDTNLINFTATGDKKKVGSYSYKISNGSNAPSVGYFKNADIKLNVEAGDILRIWANFESIKNNNLTRTIDNFAIAFSDGTSWNTRVHLGNDPAAVNAAFDSNGLGNASITHLGNMPDSNRWVPIDVDISSTGLEGRQISGMAFAIAGTYENAVSVPATLDTLAVYIDFIDVHSASGVKNYLPELEINRETSKTAFQDFSTLKDGNGLYHSGFMSEPAFDDSTFGVIEQTTNEAAFTDKLSLLVSSEKDNIAYLRTGLTPVENASVQPIKLSKKLKLPWPTDNSKDVVEYNGGAIVLWTLVTKADTGRDSLSEINIGIEYSTPSETGLLSVAKFRSAALSPKSGRPPEFSLIKEQASLSSSEVRMAAQLPAETSLYQMSDSFETILTSSLTFHNNYIDAGKVPPSDGEWTPLLIPINKIIPSGIISSSADIIKIKSISIETANCAAYFDHIGKLSSFKQNGDWQGDVSPDIFVQDNSYLSNSEIHNTEQSIDSSESVKLKTTAAGEKSFYLKLKPAEVPSMANPAGFDPSAHALSIPLTGGVVSLNVYIGTNENYLPQEIMLEFHRAGDPETKFYHRAFWGAQNISVDGIVTNDTSLHYHMGSIPDVRGGWIELLVPTEILNMNTFNFDGINVRAHSKKASGFELWFDRLGVSGTIPHAGENIRHSVYAWDLDDYVFYSMRIKGWDSVLNESEYAYSKYVRSKDRTPPIIEASMTPRINYQGLGMKEPMGGVYYIHKYADNSTAEVPLVFKDAAGNHLPGREVDLSITTEDYLNFETIDSSRSKNNKVSIGYKALQDGTSVEILLTQPTARDPLPSAEYISSTWLTNIKGLGQVPAAEVYLNDTNNVWLADPLAHYSEIRHYYMNNYNYIARQIVYDDEENFVIGGDTYIDVTPGPLSKISFYYPGDTTTVEIRASEPATIDAAGKDKINKDSGAWVGLKATDAQGNPVLKGHKINLKWNGYYKGASGITHDMNSTALETKRRIEVKPGTNLSYDTTRAQRTYYEPPPRPYFHIEKDSNSVELAKKLLSADQFNSPEIAYCTQEVEIYTYTGYNINGEAYEVGLNGKEIKNNLDGRLESGDVEAYFVTTTHAGDMLWVTATANNGEVIAQSSKFRIIPGITSEICIEPSVIEIDAESGQADFEVKKYDSFRYKINDNFKYHSKDTFDTAYKNDNESATYEYFSTNEIVVNPLWIVGSHEVEYSPTSGKYAINNAETIGVFLAEGRSSVNTFGAGWESETREIYAIDTTEVLISDASGQRYAAAAYTGSEFLTNSVELTYGLQKSPQGKDWDINKGDVFIKASATIIVRPLLKGYLSFRSRDEKEKNTQELNMNAVIGSSDLRDTLKFYVQTYNDHNQKTDYDSNTEVVVKLDTSEDEFAKLYRWPVTDITAGADELTVKLANGSAEVGLIAYNSKNRPIIKLYSKNPNYKDITTPDKRAKARVNVFPNMIDRIFFEPDISNSATPYTVVKGRSLPIKAFGYDCRGNMIAPIEYRDDKWIATIGEVKEPSQSTTHLLGVYTAKDVAPPAGGGLQSEITVKAKAKFQRWSDPLGTTTREVGIDVPATGKGFIKIVNFGLFDFPCVYQQLDKDKLDKTGEYELSFLYTTGDSPGDTRAAQAFIGVAYCRNADATSVQPEEIQVLYSQTLNSGGVISPNPFKLRFRMDGKAVSQSGSSGVNDLDLAQKIILFVGAPASNDTRPALKYDHVTIERVK